MSRPVGWMRNANLFLKQMNSVFSDSAVIIITHNISMARQCTKILVMYAGFIMEYGAVAQIIEKPVHPYTKSLIRALPINGFDVFQASTDAPKLDGEPPGCPFYRRCPISQLKCLHTMPSLEMKDGVYRRCHYA